MPTFTEHLLEHEPEEEPQKPFSHHIVDDGTYYPTLDLVMIGIKGTNRYIKYLGDIDKVKYYCQKYNVINPDIITSSAFKKLSTTEKKQYTEKIAIIDIHNGYKYEKV